MSQKTAVVTGGSRGIGKAIATELATQGYNIVINYNSSEKKANELKNTLESKYNIDVLALKCDVSSFEDVKSMYQTVKKNFDSIDLLELAAKIAPEKIAPEKVYNYV